MWQYNYSSELYHHGILGQKWGVRRYQNKDGTRTAAGKQRYSSGSSNQKGASSETTANSKKSTAKKVAIGVGATVTVAAAAAIYIKNKDAVDNFVKANVTKAVAYTPNRKTYSAVKKDNAARKYAQTHKSEILKSAAKLNKYKDYLSDSEVKDAKKRLELTRDLHQIQQDKIRRGSNYVQAVLTYGTVAVSAYNLSKSSLAKDAKKTIEKSKSG